MGHRERLPTFFRVSKAACTRQIVKPRLSAAMTIIRLLKDEQDFML